MKNDPIKICLTIFCPDSLLWWVTIICLIGALISGTAIVQLNRFITDNEGKKVSLLKFEWMINVSKQSQFLSNLKEAALNLLHRVLLIDFAFMPFLYILMVCATGITQRHFMLGNEWTNLFCLLYTLPFIIWLFDIVENGLTIRIIKQYRKAPESITKSQSIWKVLFSSLKWLTGLAWLIGMAAILLANLIANFS